MAMICMERYGAWNGLELAGMVCNGMEWYGMGWNGMEWAEIV